MKLIAAIALAALLAQQVNAGGPVVLIEENYETAEPQRTNALPIIVGLVIACAIFCGGGDDDSPVAPVKLEPVCFENGGC